MRLSKLWRVLRTGLAFASFGWVCLRLTYVTIPRRRRTIPDSQALRRAVQRDVQHVNRQFVRVMQWLGLVHLRGEGIEVLSRPGILVVANHPTLIDAPALLSQMPEAICVTKRANASNLVLGGIIAAAGYLPNDDGRALVSEGAAQIARGGSLLLFPEGTRSPKGGLAPFHRSAAHVALEANCDLLPVQIHCDPPTLMRGQKWYDVPDRDFDFTLRVGDAISIQPYREALDAGEPRPRTTRRLTAELQEFFEKGMRRGRT